MRKTACNNFPLETNTVLQYLPPLEKLPPNMVSTVLQGRMLPTLNESQTRVIKEYYTAQIPIGIPTLNQGSASGAPPVFPFSPQAVEMMRLLPPGYNMSRIPVPVCFWVCLFKLLSCSNILVLKVSQPSVLSYINNFTWKGVLKDLSFTLIPSKIKSRRFCFYKFTYKKIIFRSLFYGCFLLYKLFSTHWFARNDLKNSLVCG